MCLSGISGSEAHGDEVMVLVASLSTVVGDRGSERDLCVGWRISFQVFAGLTGYHSEPEYLKS